MMSNALVVVVMLSAASPVCADQSLILPSAARFGSLRPAQFDPYGKLFAPQKRTPQPAIANHTAAKPKVVCGMTIIPADPTIDPSMVRQPKTDGIDYKLRAIDPPICNPAR